MTNTDFQCQCPSPGYCEVFKRQMGERPWQICQGQVLTSEKCAAYRKNWGLLRDAPRVNETGQPPRRVGPGTELKKIFEQLGVTPTASCNCDARALEMDALGVEGCRRERERLLVWLREAYDEASVLTKLHALERAVLHGLPKTLAGLLDEAIRRASV